MPFVPGGQNTAGVLSYIGDVYHIMLGVAEGRVWSLEGKDRWVLEGEAKYQDLYKFGYDKARGPLLIGGRRNNKIFAFYLSTLRWELIHGVRLLQEFVDDTRICVLPRILPK